MSDKDLKVCSICKNSKPFSEFNKNKTKKDGLQVHCRDCNKIHSKKYYHSNQELHKHNATSRKKKHKQIVQQYVYDLMKRTGCKDCPENDPCCLDFDHQRDKKRLVSKMVAAGCSLENILSEIEKCEIRCANCHRKKTAKEHNWYCNIDTGS